MLNGIWVVDRCHSDKQLSGIDDESIWLHHLTTILIYGERPKIKVPWLVIKHTAWRAFRFQKAYTNSEPNSPISKTPLVVLSRKSQHYLSLVLR